MTAADLINQDILPLRTSDTAIVALSWMDEYRLSHLPVVNSTDYLGLISDTDIYNLSEFEQPVGNHSLSLHRPFVEQHQHIFEVIKIIVQLKLSLLPVLDEKNRYLGCIIFPDLVKKISEMISVENPGAIIVLEMNANDYSLTEISNIVESNDAKILNCFVTSQPDSTKISITLKINKIDFQPVLQTFNRYEYIVKEFYGESNYYDDLQERYDSLMNYLNV